MSMIVPKVETVDEEFSMLSSTLLAASLLLPTDAPEKLPNVSSTEELKEVIAQKCLDAKKSGDSKTANYYDLMQSTIGTESSWNKNAFNPRGGGRGAVGLFQIRLPMINDVNRVYKTNYKITDAYDINKAAEIYRLYYNIQNRYLKHFKPNTKSNIVDISKMYNQGCSIVTNKATDSAKKNADSYWNKIKSRLALHKFRKNFESVNDLI